MPNLVVRADNYRPAHCVPAHCVLAHCVLAQCHQTVLRGGEEKSSVPQVTTLLIFIAQFMLCRKPGIVFKIIVSVEKLYILCYIFLLSCLIRDIFIPGAMNTYVVCLFVCFWLLVCGSNL